MKKAIPVLMYIALIGGFFAPKPLSVEGAQGEDSGWVLVEVIDIDEQEDIASANEKSETYYLEGSYNRNNYSITSTYIGPSDDYYDPPILHGESISMSASFSQLPQVIKTGDKITITVSLTAADNHSYFNPFGAVKAQISKNDQSYSDFKNEKGEGSFRSDIKNNYASVNETVTATAPGGSEGDTLELRVYLYFGVKMETRYIYEWRGTGVSVPEIEQPVPTNVPAIPESYIEPLPEECEDSGVRFSDFYGEVLVRPHDDLLAWDMANLDMVLCVMDHVKTGFASEAALSLRDMSVFYMKPGSEVILDTVSEETSKLSLLAGKVWVNVKKMLKDGTMNLEMSQAVAGIKGTTLVLEETGSTSTLKVLEGTVELTASNGETILVADEEMVSVTGGMLGPLTTFSVEEEMKEWGATKAKDGSFIFESKTVQEDAARQKNSKRITNLWIFLLCGGAFLSFSLAVGLIIVFMVLRRKQKANH